VVKAFNTVHFQQLKATAHQGARSVGIPLAGDDAGALARAEQLVRDAGFEPVSLGGLVQARRFDVGTAVWNTGATADSLRRQLAS
jgi:predicted dinucleotide-binding enzyme